MPFFNWDQMEREFVTPKYSTAFGPTVYGEQVEVCRLSYKAGTGAVPHQHPQEQIMCILEGKLRVWIDGEGEKVLGPGEVSHMPSNVLHSVTALDQDVLVLSCKKLVDGKGHKI